jgi:hypothetical protein
MGRGPDLTVVERAIIHAKILANWDSENNRIKHGKIYEIQKLCANCGVRVSKGSVKRLAGEMKAQEGHAEKIFQETGEVTGTIEELIAAGTGDGWTPLIITQPPNSPDVNINDLGFFHSLKTDIRKICTHCTSRTEMMANVLQAFEEYPWDKLDGVWACYFNNLRSIMACDGGNDYKQAHNGVTKRKRDTGSAIDLSINLDDYDRCLRLCRG